MNDRSGASQWEFPTEEDNSEDSKGTETQTPDQSDTKLPGAVATGQSLLLPLPKQPRGVNAFNYNLFLPLAPTTPPQPGTSSLWSPSQPPLPDSPPPPPCAPPPPPLPPDSPPPPPPLPDSDGEIMEVEMEMDDDDTEPPAPGTEEEAGTMASLPPGAAGINVHTCSAFFCVFSCCFCMSVFHILLFIFAFLSPVQLLEAWGCSVKGLKRQKSGQQNKAIIGSSPILYTQSAITAGKNNLRHPRSFCVNQYYHAFHEARDNTGTPNVWGLHYSTFMREGFHLSAAPLMTAAAYWGIPAVAAPLVPCEPPPPPVPALPPQPPQPPPQPPSEPAPPKTLPTDKTKKVKKDKVGGGPG